MSEPKSYNNLNSLKLGTHLCCIYETKDEYKSLLKKIFSQGLEQNHKILYISDSISNVANQNYFQDIGIDINPYIESGQFKVLNAPKAYTLKGAFNPEAMISLLKNETECALSGGYSALRVASEMSWSLQELLGCERLIEFDAKLNEFFPNNKCIMICLYDVQHFEPDALLDVFATHPKIIVGNEIYDNHYYLMPSDFFGENRSAITLQKWLDNLIASNKAENPLDKLSNAVKLSMDSIIIGNLDGKIIDVNDATLKMQEIEEKKQLIGKEFFNMLAPDEQEIALQNMKQMMKDGVHSSNEYNIVTKKGKMVPVETNIELMKGNDGKPLGFIGIFKNISKRRDIEEKLRESEEKYKTLFNSLPEAIALIGLDGSIWDCNDTVEKLTGHQKKELLGKSLMDLNIFSSEDVTNLIEIIPKIISGESIGPIDMALQYDNRTKWIEVFPTLLKKNNKAHAMQLIVRDISERKQAEEVLKRKLMKFKLDDGKVYMVKESIPSLSIEAFKDLLNIKFAGMAVSRTPEKHFKRAFGKNNFEFLWLTDNSQENTKVPKLFEIEKKIEDLTHKKAIFIDRVDYIIFKSGFKKTLSFVQHLRELAYLKGHVVIISIDPITLSKQELCLLEKECDEVKPRMEKKKLPDEHFKLLRTIYEDNIIGDKPSYTKIGQDLGISKPTIRKRLRMLIAAGYVLEIVKGRNKVVELTDLGRNMFFK